ncbi:hypothetical protein SLEP1_g34823 [Rubroshorea leprosula]|uniref:Anticodon-binding domain-containing protein n=1 Tax=Rubroshorea leprosula TaxID=152421 RepID=A0AAV5KL82_9ROSI|nr:hypothetical protein SLEP1_g34823 [Rubroshorea leprosula]
MIIWSVKEQFIVLSFFVQMEKPQTLILPLPIHFNYDLKDNFMKRGLLEFHKTWSNIQGVPLRIEIGPHDVSSGSVVISRRDVPGKEG